METAEPYGCFYTQRNADYYDAAGQDDIIWNDPTLAIDWPIGGNSPIFFNAVRYGICGRGEWMIKYVCNERQGYHFK